jgi:uncharacterized protein
VDRFFNALAAWVLSHRALVTLFLVVSFTAASVGVVWLQIDFSVRAFFGGDDPARVFFDEHREAWGADDKIVIAVVEAGGQDIGTPERLATLAALERALEASDLIERVESVATAAPVVGADPGVIVLDPIVDTLPSDPSDQAAWRARLADHPMLVPGMLSVDGSTAAMLITLKVASDDVQAVQPAVAGLNELLDPWQGRDGMTYGLAGIPAVRAAFFSRFLGDQAMFVPIAFILIQICLFAMFRNVSGVVVPVLAAGLPVVMVFGFMGWTGEPVGLMNQIFATLLPAIAVADAIHLVSRFREEARELAPPGSRLSPDQRDEAIRRALSRIGAACLMTSVTTAIGFVSLYAANMPILRTFGLYAALGIVLAYGGVLFVAPLALTLTRGVVPGAEQPSVADRVLDKVGAFSVTRPRTVLAVTAVVLLGALWMGRSVVIDNFLTVVLHEGHPTTIANRTADRELGGILTLEIDVRGEPDVVLSPEVLAAMHDVQEKALEHPAIRQAFSVATYVSLLHEAITGERIVPTSGDAVAQLLLLAEGDEALDELLSTDRDRARVILRARDEGGREFDKMANSVRDHLLERFEGLDVQVDVTGTPFVAYRGINRVTEDLRDSLALAFVLITIVLAILLRDLRTSLLALVPNALPLVVGYGFLGWTGWLLDPSPAVIFTVALGIAVDDTIHLLARTREEQARGASLHEAIRIAVRRSGHAVAITTLILCIGFGVNALSSFQATAVLGALGTVVIFTALLCDVFVLPAMLALWGRETPGLERGATAPDRPAAAG